MRAQIQTESGFAAFLAIAMMTLLTVIGLVAVQVSNDEVTLAGNERQELRTFYASEAGLEAAVAAIQSEYNKTGLPPATMPSGSYTLNHSIVDYKVVDDGPAETKSLTTDAYAGLHGVVKTFSATAVSVDQIDGASTTIRERFEVALIPLFQYGIFYNDDLEINSGLTWDIGRIHSNGNFYIGNNNTLRIESFVTAAGRIIHDAHPASGLLPGTGDIEIRDNNGNFVKMNQGGTYLDSYSANWFDSSTGRWDGRVQDTIHDFQPLPVPLSGVGAETHDMLERYNAGANPNSMENRATLKIMNQKVYQEVAGLWVDVTATAALEGWYSTANNSFTDYREAEDVDAVEIDMSLFAASTLYPPNGIVYVSDQHASRDYPALHLKNGTDIGGDLTFVSENPVYIEGDYNTAGKRNAAVISDAVTFLSTDWSSHKAQPLVADRGVSGPMTVNCSFATGHVESDGGNYSGGAENLIRYLEDWGGRTVTWRGSLVCLWESEQANDKFNYSYFVPPQTDYAFDPDLEDPLNSPPGSPIVRAYRRFGWQHETVGYANVQAAP